MVRRVLDVRLGCVPGVIHVGEDCQKSFPRQGRKRGQPEECLEFLGRQGFVEELSVRKELVLENGNALGARILLQDGSSLVGMATCQIRNQTTKTRLETKEKTYI